MSMNMRRHGWQRPLHPLQLPPIILNLEFVFGSQMVGMTTYSFLVVAFYTFLGLFLGNRIADVTVTTVFSVVALLVMFLFIRCTAADPTDRSGFKKKSKAKPNGASSLNYGFLLSQIVARFLRRLERKILRNFIRSKYLDPLKVTSQMEPLLPFPLLLKDDIVEPHSKDDEISYCSLCDFEVKKHSKHCRTCNRCVEGFDHHCRWLNNCVGKRNYTTFFLLMAFILLMLIMEGAIAIVVFIRCFADKNAVEAELKKKLSIDFPRGILATISVLLVLMIAYSSAAMGQLFFFHVVLMRKRRTNRWKLDQFEDSDFSSDSDFESPERRSLVSRYICGHRGKQSPVKLSVKIDKDPEPNFVTKKQGFQVSINPWKLIKLSRDKALLAAEKARERLLKQRTPEEQRFLKAATNRDMNNLESGSAPLITKGKVPGSPGRFSSPRRRFSGSEPMISGAVPSPKNKYRNSFDLKLTEVSKELEIYISRQVLCCVIKKNVSEASPR
ncbi:hypothetical protein K2173_008127 [Erythroxylum novogranatense]|uniref:S-acyltransferase n=1 Tax=Erythroxylum novogranatense TaxID=1862640 RepID=A0AAV8S981_9ROSI|nr:hypothetical protein K2173_008127 [Erythroxylum novogranatense]